MTERCAAYHHRVYAVTLKRLPGFFGRSDVAVAYYGDVYARITLHFAYQSPVCLTCVHLRPCASVYRQSLYSAVLKLLGQLGYYEVVAVPSEPCLHRYGHFHRLDHLACYVEQQRNVLQHACSGALACHLLDRTAEVDVYQVGPASSTIFAASTICGTSRP